MRGRFVFVVGRHFVTANNYIGILLHIVHSWLQCVHLPHTFLKTSKQELTKCICHIGIEIDNTNFNTS